MARGERTPVFTPWHNAHTLMPQTYPCQPTGGSKPSMHYCLPPFAYFAVDMYRRIFMRLSAKGKIYRYRIWTAHILPPFEYRRAWHIAQPLDLKVLKSATR